ncbi:hypothetical protein [Paenibacillus sp. LjRoot56]|uniref:hypothetical protein n=1 Tax=Paenibacillus sp. LjRoot56 TaxID=3342333 RepID=UPI003ED0C82D
MKTSLSLDAICLSRWTGHEQRDHHDCDQTALNEMNKWVQKWGKPQQVNGKTSISS